jgi:NAD(P)-dependent dehydrogenase (short-subunit alcohol dehydrogenase family)
VAEPMAPDVVLITGSSTGMGLETSMYLAARNYKVYATVPFESDIPIVEAAARERGVSVRVIPLDVTDDASIDAAVRVILDEAGSIYALVNNAGLGLRGCFEDITDSEMREIYNVNLFGAMAVTRRVLPTMLDARRGRIVHITSVGGRIASFGLSGYCSTKFALEGFGEALALEVAPFGVRSIMVEPGIISTPHWTVNRGTAQHALDPTSRFATMFARHEAIADWRTARSKITVTHVAAAIYEAIHARNPRMRYVVGLPASIMVLGRRYLPERWFEALYFGLLLRRVTRGVAKASNGGVRNRA